MDPFMANLLVVFKFGESFMATILNSLFSVLMVTNEKKLTSNKILNRFGKKVEKKKQHETDENQLCEWKMSELDGNQW